MAGEQIYRFGGGKITTIDWTADANGSKGDLVVVGRDVGFLLDDVTSGKVVAVGLECDLATVPQPSTAKAWKAGEPVAWHNGEIALNTALTSNLIGYVHHDTAASETRVPIVWRSTNDTIGNSFYQALNPTTTPPFGGHNISVTGAEHDITASSHPNGQSWVLCETTTLGIRANIPIEVDYEGDLLFRLEQKGLVRLRIGYVMWHSDAQKKATIWRSAWREGIRNQEVGVAMDVFSNHNLLPIGAPVPNDMGNNTVVTADDFTNGIPVQIVLNVAGFANQSFTNRNDIDLRHLELFNPQVVTKQVGGVIV